MTDRKRIAVAHHNLMEKGGAEGVSMNVLESLQHRYNVTLLTLTDPDIPELNDYYNTNVDLEAITIEQFGPFFPTLYRHTDKFHLFKNACLSRLVKRERHRFMLVISTYNEFSFRTRSLQYIHLPQFRRWIAENNAKYSFHHIYDKFCGWIEEFDVEDIRSNDLVANSEWTADVTKEAYGVSPDVIYPPVDTAEFVDTPWDECENGFVTIGRITEKKNVLRTIKIIKQLRDRGHDIHLHIIGPTLDTDYVERIEAAATTLDFVHLEGEVSRAEIVELVSSHRYGIHGMDYEHFGMAVAELAAGGTIPFVPDGGGQREIVHEREELLYETADEAVEKIDDVLLNPDLRHDLRTELNDTEERFGRERFKGDIREMVNNILNESKPAIRTSP